MPSQLKSDTSRANGAKSHGPKTAETRAISSQNSLSHGFTSCHTTLLECENAGEFQQCIDGHFDTYRPANPAQENLVNDMISARWRIRRIRIAETLLIDLEMTRHKADVEKIYTDPIPGVHLAEAFRTLIDDSRALSLVSRYESRLQRLYYLAYRTLRELQKTEPSQPPSERHEPAAPHQPHPGPDPPLPLTGVSPEPAPPSAPDSKNDETNLPRPAASRCLRPSRLSQTHESATLRFLPVRRAQASAATSHHALSKLLRRQ